MNSALEYTTKAIELNPDYVKPYVRRSRIYKLKKDYRAAISDLAKLFIVHANTKDSEKYLSDLADVSNTILTDNVEKVYKVILL
jgi:tetratricopeptide (TPR) repeat protein